MPQAWSFTKNPAKPAWIGFWNDRRDDFLSECLTARLALLADLATPEAVQDRVLADIVEISFASAHWREQGFDALKSVDSEQLKASFRRTLPIMRYEDFVPLLDREAHTKGGVLTCSPVLRWLRTSGTTGRPKLVPYTLHWLIAYRMPAIRAMWGTYLHLHPELLDEPYATLDTQTVREAARDFVHGVEYQAVSNRNPPLNDGDWNPPWYHAPWFDEDVPTEHEERMYHRVRHLLGKDLRYISAINPSTLISFHGLIYQNRDQLVSDLFHGTLRGKPWGAPNPQEAVRLEGILADPDFSLTQIWPSLTLYSCWLSGSAGLYQSKLDGIMPGVDKLPFMSCGTEGVTAIPVDATLTSQPLSVNQAFYEFVPADIPLGELLDAGESVETKLLDELEVGQDYHLIMSQGNGLYRLWTGDIYHVERMVNGVPWVYFVRRDGVFHSFTGEKLTEADVTQALRQGFAGMGVDLGLYLCGPQWAEPPHYVVTAESAAPSPSASERLSALVDRALAEVNIEYASKRDSARLGPIRVQLVQNAAIAEYVESMRTDDGAAQYKYKPFQRNTTFMQQISAVKTLSTTKGTEYA
ncbi:GH3 family domain-containing protein [Gordonia sp. CPCC 205333]|uniref:GH3 family domain-containing protein n=1 Tax=Gordonia sp. CPCC 205333 TaxID=3140790 RepID=UPI003AF38FE1